MTGLSGMLAETCASWLSIASQCWCCAPSTGRSDDNPKPKPSFSEKQSMAVLRDQPSPTPRPYYRGKRGQEPHEYVPHRLGITTSVTTEEEEKSPRKSMASMRSKSGFSVRRHLHFRSKSNSTQRRPQISAPSNFRHLHSESFQFPQYTHLQTVGRPRPTAFRPIELSIYRSDKHLSPILPHFEFPGITPPSRALLGNTLSDEFTLDRERSRPSAGMSFHVPRKPTASPQTSLEDTPPKVPPKSRARAHTSPDVERMKDRIANAMNEVEKLQREIDSVIERQSIYAASTRASSPQSMAPTELEPMPSIPALPPAAPSFAERLSPGGDNRPRTAPSMPVNIPSRATTFADASAAFITPPPSRESEDQPPPPPLPLVLRPPLRKKKSFSRVSNWLFPPGNGDRVENHQRDISLDSVTNLPRPVKGREGFYQCVAAPDVADDIVSPVSGDDGEAGGRRSLDSVSTVSTWVTEDEQTAPTTWSPGSTPLAKQNQESLAPSSMERSTRLGKGGVSAGGDTPGAKRQSVGVAI